MQNSQMINDFDKLTILGAIKDEMNSRGFEHVETNGELVVSTFVIIEHETSYQAYTDHYGWMGKETCSSDSFYSTW